MKTKFLPFACFLTGLFTLVTPARGQSTVFTYQGRLTENGSPASGLHDFEFRLYDASVGGAQVGSPVTLTDLGVTNGLFIAALDFGAAFNGSARFLDIAVRPGASSGTYTNLVPRQPITSAPYAVRALQAASVPAGAITSGMLAPGAVNQLGSPDGSPLVALQVNTNGLVGLGTATPASALHIASAQSMLNYELASVRVDDSAGYTNLGGAFGVAVQGNLLAVAAYSDSGVTLMDVTDPAGPILRSQIRDGDGAFTNLSGATGVAMKPNLLAVAASSESAVTLINVTDPVNPDEALRIA